MIYSITVIAFNYGNIYNKGLKTANNSRKSAYTINTIIFDKLSYISFQAKIFHTSLTPDCIN